jgi:hypothetical protein
VLLDAGGRLVAADDGHDAQGEQLADLTKQLLDCARTSQIEVSTGVGIVYAMRQGGWTLGVVAGRFALSSLVFFDMRRVLEELEG